MKPVQIALLSGLVLLALLVGYLALRTRQAPLLPADADHGQFVNAESCLGACHGPDGTSPQGKNHSPRLDCMSCHGRQ